MSVSEAEARAWRNCLSILAPLASPHERKNMSMNVEAQINQTATGSLAIRFEHLGALFFPGDSSRAGDLANEMRSAAIQGELPTCIPDKQGAFITDLAAWPGCPLIPVNSPLRYWLPHLKTVDSHRRLPSHTSGAEEAAVTSPIFRQSETRLSVAEAKSLVLGALPREESVSVFATVDDAGEIDFDGPMEFVHKQNASIQATFIDLEVLKLFAELGIRPRNKYRPSFTDFTGAGEQDAYYTITHDELVRFADVYGVSVTIGTAPLETDPRSKTSPSPDESLLPAAESQPAPQEQLTLPTGKLAEAFDGIFGSSSEMWKSRLADTRNHSWVLPARITRGVAPKPSAWCPLEFARLLLKRGAKAEELRRLFISQRVLSPWREKWQEEDRERNAFGQ